MLRARSVLRLSRTTILSPRRGLFSDEPGNIHPIFTGGKICGMPLPQRKGGFRDIIPAIVNEVRSPSGQYQSSVFVSMLYMLDHEHEFDLMGEILQKLANRNSNLPSRTINKFIYRSINNPLYYDKLWKLFKRGVYLGMEYDMASLSPFLKHISKADNPAAVYKSILLLMNQRNLSFDKIAMVDLFNSLPVIMESGTNLVTEIFVKLEEWEKKGLEIDLLVLNTAISVLEKCEEVAAMEDIVERIKILGLKPDYMTYKNMIEMLCSQGQVLRALEYFREFQASQKRPPPHSFFHTLIKELGVRGFFHLANEVEDDMVKLTSKNIANYNVMIANACKQNNESRVSVILDQMNENGCPPDKYTFHPIIATSKTAKHLSGILVQMKNLGFQPCPATHIAVINSLIANDQKEQAITYFTSVVRSHKDKRESSFNLGHYHSFLDCCLKNDAHQYIPMIFENVKESNLTPTRRTMELQALALLTLGKKEAFKATIERNQSLMNLNLFQLFCKNPDIFSLLGYVVKKDQEKCLIHLLGSLKHSKHKQDIEHNLASLASALGPEKFTELMCLLITNPFIFEEKSLSLLRFVMPHSLEENRVELTHALLLRVALLPSHRRKKLKIPDSLLPDDSQFGSGLKSYFSSDVSAYLLHVVDQLYQEKSGFTTLKGEVRELIEKLDTNGIEVANQLVHFHADNNDTVKSFALWKENISSGSGLGYPSLVQACRRVQDSATLSLLNVVEDVD